MARTVNPMKMTSEELEQFLILCEVEKALNEQGRDKDSKIIEFPVHTKTINQLLKQNDARNNQ